VVEELKIGSCDHSIVVIVKMKNERDSGTDEEKGGDGGSYVCLLACFDNKHAPILYYDSYSGTHYLHSYLSFTFPIPCFSSRTLFFFLQNYPWYNPDYIIQIAPVHIIESDLHVIVVFIIIFQ